MIVSIWFAGLGFSWNLIEKSPSCWKGVTLFPFLCLFLLPYSFSVAFNFLKFDLGNTKKELNNNTKITLLHTTTALNPSSFTQVSGGSRFSCLLSKFIHHIHLLLTNHIVGRGYDFPPTMLRLRMEEQQQQQRELERSLSEMTLVQKSVVNQPYFSYQMNELKVPVPEGWWWWCIFL